MEEGICPTWGGAPDKQQIRTGAAPDVKRICVKSALIWLAHPPTSTVPFLRLGG
jgi:hypothetical protein